MKRHQGALADADAAGTFVTPLIRRGFVDTRCSGAAWGLFSQVKRDPPASVLVCHQKHDRLTRRCDAPLTVSLRLLVSGLREGVQIFGGCKRQQIFVM